MEKVHSAIVSNSSTELIMIGEIARILAVSVRTIRYWVARNEIPYLKIGKHVRFDLAEVLLHFRKETSRRNPTCLGSVFEDNERATRSLKTGNDQFTPKGVKNGYS